MKYAFLTLFILLQLACFGQPPEYGKYFRRDAYNGVFVQLNKNNTCVYRLDGETGKAAFYGTYTIKNNRLHITITPPRDNQKLSILYKGDNAANRTIKLVDDQRMGYLGASVELNRQLQLITDTNGSVSLPQGFVVRIAKLSYITLIDTTLALDDPGKGNMEILLPGKHPNDIQYDLIISDWLIKDHQLYPVHQGKVDPTYFLKRGG